ncbi:MAG: NfeD family protein, partial [bacterium]|nr:NfeD family protein [bacterium]
IAYLEFAYPKIFILRAIESLTPVGVVRVGGEIWKAKSVGENIEADEEVEIVVLSGLTLMVKNMPSSPPLSPRRLSVKLDPFLTRDESGPFLIRPHKF